MEKENIIASISKRGNGQIYLGVVGACRTGKSTFIKRFIENLVAPNIEDEYEKKKCLDELPQCGQGKAIMTTEPKFVPSSGATIKVDNFKTDIELVDCVGYVTENALGFKDEDGNPRMVKSPWSEDYIPLTEAAEIGTKKVIKDHATIGIVVTTDGTITELERSSYVEAEMKVINELKEIGKPYIVLLNSTNPESMECKNLANSLEEAYDAPVIACSVDNLKEKDFMDILRTALYEFPVEDINISLPAWVNVLPMDHEIKKEYLTKIKDCMYGVSKLKDTTNILKYFENSSFINRAYISALDSSTGLVTLNLESSDELYDSVLNDMMGRESLSKADLLSMFITSSEDAEELKNIKTALKMAKNTGYGIVYPSLNDMNLDNPEIIKAGSRYGVKLKAKASSIHMIKVDVESTFEPIIGSEMQSKEVIDYILKDSAEDKTKIWQSEIFGRSLETIVKDGITAKLSLMNDNTRFKLSNTVTKIVNKGANNLIAIVL